MGWFMSALCVSIVLSSLGCVLMVVAEALEYKPNCISTLKAIYSVVQIMSYNQAQRQGSREIGFASIEGNCKVMSQRVWIEIGVKNWRLVRG